MRAALIALAAAVLVAAGAALPAYWIGDGHGAARVQQEWDRDIATRAIEAAGKTEEARTEERSHANDITQATDKFNAARAPAAADSATRIADAERLQRAAESRAAGYRAMSEAGEAERHRLAGHAARLDEDLAAGRLVAESLRAELVDRDQRIELLADVIRADGALLGRASDDGAGQR
ncbi:hypothetical protein [Variovorax sp. CY25R-8]|uniref:hypothetical protein n=1 Tax=Variovorax sp. CY25R-8 TaxID=2855501 RepID=UPI0021BA4B25|nr:hypothetical protein [Variovorax sp. CY25R-8]MCT8178138.1 hypothetical protein [Variovorax sp. CY25R-8]